MKKVLLIGPYPPLFSYGGPTRSISALYESLKNSFNITVLSPNSNLDGSKNFKIHTFPSSPLIKKNIFAILFSTKTLLTEVHR